MLLLMYWYFFGVFAVVALLHDQRAGPAPRSRPSRP